MHKLYHPLKFSHKTNTHKQTHTLGVVVGGSSMQKGREKWHSNGGKLYRFGEIWRWRLKEKDSEGILGRWIMLRMGNREGETQKHVDRQQQRGGGSSYCGRGGGGVSVVDGGRLGYMTFVSMVMVSPSPTRREMVL